MKSRAVLVSCTLLLALFAGSVGAADVPRFDVLRYQVEGNTLLPTDEINRHLAPFTGANRDFADLQQAVEALEDAYRSRGYHAVRVVLPEQELKGGVVQLKVAETRIAAVIVEGNRHFDSANIRAGVPALAEGIAPNIDRISAQIRVVNENPSKKLQMVLQQADREDSLNAVLKVADEKPWKAGISLDDTGNSQTGDLRLGFLLQHANLFDRDHLLTLQYTTSPDHADKVSIYNAGYRIPFYRWGGSLEVYGGYSDVDSGQVQSGTLSLNVSGKGTFAGIRYNQNLSRNGAYEHRLMYGFDYRRFQSNINRPENPEQLGTTTEAHPVSLGYAGVFSPAGGGEVDGWVAIAQNIPFGEKGDAAAYRNSARPDSPADFTIFRAGVSAVYPFLAEWQVHLAGNGQYTWEPLIQGEQFGVGGQNSVRGFEERELADDSGVTANLELYTPNLLKRWNPKDTQLRALTFYDVGYLDRNKPQPGESRDRSASSTGLGLRLAIDRHVTAATDYAFVLEPQGRHGRGSGRWHFNVHFIF